MAGSEDLRFYRLSGIRAVQTTPLVARDGRIVGMLSTHWREMHEPTERELGVLDVLAQFAGDLIERKRAEHEIEEGLRREQDARAAAEAAVRVRDVFLSIASHELRTPVTVLNGTAQMLQRLVGRNTLDRNQLSHHVDAIRRASDRLTRLVNDLFDVSRLQSGQLSLQVERIDLAELLRQIIERFTDQLGEERFSIDEQANAAVFVVADALRLEQVFDNLLSNAEKYSEARSAIHITIHQDRDGVTVVVRDHGIGLPEGAAERIFEPFGRAENAVVQGLPGMGLGLFVSRRIAELHGGRLWAESAGEGQGTAMYLRLPVAGESEATVEPGQI